MKYLLLLLITLPATCIAQSATFQEIHFTNEHSAHTDTVIKYPVIILSNVSVAKKINEVIKRRIFWDDDDTSKQATFLLQRDREDRYLNTSYKVQFNKNGILSFIMMLEGTGTYTSNWNEYFNFDLNTGNELSLHQLIRPEKYETFKAKVFKRKKDFLSAYLKDTKQRLDSGEISQDLYDEDTLLVSENGCMDSVSLNIFHINNSFIEIHDECFFPHVAMAEQPYYQLTYNITTLKEILKPEIFQKLTSK